MGKYASAIAKTGLGLPGPATCTSGTDVPQLLELTHDADPMVRSLAAKNLCGCHVRTDRQEIWDRVLELLGDPEAGVRSDAVHALGDGSPNHRAHEFAAALEPLHNDPDPHLRKRVRKVLQHYRRTGSVNCL
jgi:HEAT repeat protein